MVGTPDYRHPTRRRRTAAILAQRAIAAVSPIRERDRSAEGRGLVRNWSLEVAPEPQFAPVCFATPQPLQRVDWAKIAGALFTIAECEARQRLNDNTN